MTTRSESRARPLCRTPPGLTRVSQIPRGERLRSDSASCPDNIWGFPSYAVREALSATSLRKFVEPLFQVAVEPIFTDYYTPRAGQAFETMEKEYHRISYPETVVKGQVRMVRRRLGGGYFTILTPPEGVASTRRVAFRSRFVHIARGLQTQILHVFRTFVTGSHGPHIWMRRPGGDGWAYQGFNYPKSVWGGQLKARVRKLEGQERADLYRQFGGTNTPKRKMWQKQMARGRREGWCHPFQGGEAGRRVGVTGQPAALLAAARPCRPGRHAVAPSGSERCAAASCSPLASASASR